MQPSANFQRQHQQLLSDGYGSAAAQYALRSAGIGGLEEARDMLKASTRQDTHLGWSGRDWNQASKLIRRAETASSQVNSL